MNALDERLEREIVSRIRQVSRPSRVILFGSRAAGTATGESDIDLLVVEDEVENTRHAAVEIRAALSGLGLRVDVVVLRTDRFEETKNVIGGVAYPAHRHGEVIYEAA